MNRFMRADDTKTLKKRIRPRSCAEAAVRVRKTLLTFGDFFGIFAPRQGLNEKVLPRTDFRRLKTA